MPFDDELNINGAEQTAEAENSVYENENTSEDIIVNEEKDEEKTENTDEEQNTEQISELSEEKSEEKFGQNINPYGGYPYPNYYGYVPPEKKKLNTSVKALIIVCSCLTAAFLFSFIGYWAANGAKNIFDNFLSAKDMFDDFNDIIGEDFPADVPDESFSAEEIKPNKPEENPFISQDFSLTLKPNIIENNEASNVRKAYNIITSSTVAVAVSSEDSDNYDDYDVQGSGIIISADGYIVTNSHVIDDDRSLHFMVILNNSDYYFADLVGLDVRTDIAVLKLRDIENAELVPAEFADSDEVLIGEQVIAVGSPGGIEFQNSLSNGVVSAVDRIVSDRKIVKYIQTNAAINPGNSGGPLANLSGQVIGINTIKISGTSYEGMGFAIPSRAVKEIVDDIISCGYVRGRVKIGIVGTAVSESDAEKRGLPYGIEIYEISENGPLYGKNIKKGDILAAIDGYGISSFAEIYALLDNYSDGDEVTLTIYRPSNKDNENFFEVTVTLFADYGADS